MQRTHRRLTPPTPLMVVALSLCSSVALAQPAEEAPAEESPAAEAPAEEAASEAPPAESKPSTPPATEAKMPEETTESVGGEPMDPVSGDTPLEVAEEPQPLPESPLLPEEKPAAEPKKPSFVISPSFFNRYELRRNYSTVGKTAGRFSDFDAMAFRGRMKFEVKDISIGKSSSLDIVLNPQASGFWEMSGNIGDQYELMMHEAYMLAHFGSGHSFQMGRFEMAYGDQWLIGPVGWHQTGRAFDGVRQHISFGGNGWLDLFGAWLQDGEFGDASRAGTDRVHDGDAFLIGAYTDIGPMIMQGMNLDVYALMHLWAATDDLPNADPTMPDLAHDAAAELTLGARAKASYGVLDYRLEGGLQAGKRVVGAATPDVIAGAADLEVGFKVHPKLRLAVEGFFYSGDDPTTPEDEGWIDRYSTAHKFNGWTDVMLPRTDQAGGVFHAVSALTAKTKVGAIGHVFLRPHPFGTQADGYNGFEIDLFAQQALMPGLNLRMDYDLFIPGEDAYPTGEPVHYLGIELRYEGSATFGG